MPQLLSDINGATVTVGHAPNAGLDGLVARLIADFVQAKGQLAALEAMQSQASPEAVAPAQPWMERAEASLKSAKRTRRRAARWVRCQSPQAADALVLMDPAEFLRQAEAYATARATATAAWEAANQGRTPAEAAQAADTKVPPPPYDLSAVVAYSASDLESADKACTDVHAAFELLRILLNKEPFDAAGLGMTDQNAQAGLLQIFGP